MDRNRFILTSTKRADLRDIARQIEIHDAQIRTALIFPTVNLIQDEDAIIAIFFLTRYISENKYFFSTYLRTL